ncbi:MAG: hypothetical protein IPK99_00650 [Flavobacteriales bacterium]|nr:hypothetical protein [Flavobacteriales bacterium]
MRSIAAALCVLVCVFSMHGQEQFGMVHGNYAGVDGAALNPARLAGQWPYASIRLVGADLFVWNNLVALSGKDHTLMGEVRDGMSGTSGDIVLRESLRSDRKKAFVLAQLPGPAFSLSLGKGTLSAGVRARSLTSLSGISTELGRFIFHGLGHAPQHGIRYRDQGTRALMAAWSEVNVSYARILSSEGFALIRRRSLGALPASAHRWCSPTERARLHGAGYHAGHRTRTERELRLCRCRHERRPGWGADLGVQYERTMEGSRSLCAASYLHRVQAHAIPVPDRSVAPRPWGQLLQEAIGGHVEIGSTTIADYNDLDLNGAEGLDSLFGTVANWTVSEKLRIGNPTALALQYDQRVMDRVYVACDLVQQLSSRYGTRLRRPNGIAVTPRFDTRWFEASVPVVFHEYGFGRPSVGLMLRFSDVAIGSDHVLPFLTRPNVSGADLYFRVRISLARSPFCKGKRRSSARRTSGRAEALPCTIPGE